MGTRAEWVTHCGTCDHTVGVVRDYQNPDQWRTTRHAVRRFGPICGGSRVQVASTKVFKAVAA